MGVVIGIFLLMSTIYRWGTSSLIYASSPFYPLVIALLMGFMDHPYLLGHFCEYTNSIISEYTTATVYV
jgi:hypothetical protein